MVRQPGRPRRAWAALAVAAVVLGGAAAFVVVATTGSDDSAGSAYDHPFADGPGGAEVGTATEAGSAGAPGFDDPSIREFLPYLVQDVEGYWEQQFQRAGRPYLHARVLVFRGSREGPCGTASAETGPFYCPRDRRLYLELGYFDALAEEFRGRGDLALTYVVAHAIAHNVQAASGIADQLGRAKLPPEELTLRTELQADCLAGAWAYSAYGRGLPDDLDEALRTAAAVSDARIRRMAPGKVVPETWTHGSAAQRRAWFLRGFAGGDPAACDTFSAPVRP
jgi:predicted metalloprotease